MCLVSTAPVLPHNQGYGCGCLPTYVLGEEEQQALVCDDEERVPGLGVQDRQPVYPVTQ
jgi:hypothetical protein